MFVIKLMGFTICPRYLGFMQNSFGNHTKEPVVTEWLSKPQFAFLEIALLTSSPKFGRKTEVLCPRIMVPLTFQSVDVRLRVI